MITIRFYRIYDIGLDIDLDWLEKELASSFTTARASFVRVRPTSIIIDVSPLLIRLGQCNVEKDGENFKFSVFARIFRVGAISLCLAYEKGDADFKFLEKTALLFSEQEGLEELFLSHLNTLADILKPHIKGFSFTPDFFEDYTIYHMDWMDDSIDPMPLLAGEKIDFSPQMREEILKGTHSYSKNDRAIFSWDSALICDPDTPTDLFDLIEFANVQVFELRYYDRELSRSMEKMYDDIALADKLSFFRRRQLYRTIMTQLMQDNVALSEVTEKVNNLIKVTEDVYYARVYATVLKTLRSEQWSESVNRKIDMIKDNYSMLSDEVRIEHSNYLEWIIIVLIAIEIVMAVVERIV
ncbi:hypothetical protein V7O61_11800 [Methanolobus sp. WCC1]|jgi:ribosome-binding factor A|uniref:DUF155 domain-containing protein n=1 Tax=Methanolobus tindarius DSM 2278 TaxID=1090322 RepID=W9DQ84_METTI|nr:MULTISPECIES: hypothetical protein [Methanolobus]ETA68649.1 hypothetical protein MettiDRAFT_2123 [Methanolobus tindarius DSM 2278]MDK2831518.1 hypothetical protein [Methanolobus sp.]